MLLQSSSFYRKYYCIFKVLDLSGIPDKNYGVGRTGYSRHAMIRAFIVIEQIKSVPRLIYFLDSHPVLIEMCGFSPGCLPDASQFYRFLSEIPHSLLEKLFYSINQKLVNKGIVSTTHFIMDSKPVMAATRENNLKNPNRNTRNKNKKPKHNPHATLGYYSCQKINTEIRNLTFYWGYRTHVIISKEGVPLVEVTLPNNATDAKVARKLIKKLKRWYHFEKGAIFIGDAAYDERDLYDFITRKMKSQVFIPINPRNQQEDKLPGPHGYPLCDSK